MKKTIFVIAALAALVASSVAVAHLNKSVSLSPVSATLSAPTSAHVSTRTLTCDTQTIEVTDGRYTGTSVSTTPDLAGPVELKVHSVYNTTTKLGTVSGSLTIGAVDDRSKAHFTAINSDGKLDGWLLGSAGHRDGSIFGSLSGSFSKTGGLTDGQLGTGTGANTAVLAKRVECKKSESPRPSVHLLVRGEVDAVSATSISVKPKDGSATQTCTVKSADDVKRIEKGDQVEMTCVQVAGVWTLAKVHERH
jgi:hypothetical protein